MKGGCSARPIAMAHRLVATAVAAAVLMTGAAPPAAAIAAEPFVVIANPSVPGTVVHRADLAAVFLKKAVRWGDGSHAVPVDQSGTSSVRKAFCDVVLQLPVTEVLQYWHKQLLSPTAVVTLPPVKGTDNDVLGYIAATPGAVGYVSADATLPAGVKALRLVD